MIRSVQRTALVLSLSLALAGSAAAQQRPTTQRRPPQPQPPIGLAGFALVGADWLAATESFEAVGLDSRQTEIGGGARVSNIWRRLFVQVSGSRWKADGERTFIDSAGNRFPLGIPLDVSATYVDVTAGWRFAPGRGRVAQRLTPYIGGGVGLMNYSESSPFGEPDDDFDERFTTSHVVGGLEVRLARWIGVAAELRYRHVPDALGEGGASDVLNENSLGGPSATVRFVVGR